MQFSRANLPEILTSYVPNVDVSSAVLFSLLVDTDKFVICHRNFYKFIIIRLIIRIIKLLSDSCTNEKSVYVSQVYVIRFPPSCILRYYLVLNVRTTKVGDQND